jgi:hypothetical protein
MSVPPTKVPLCRPHHREHHSIGHPRYDAKYRIRLLALVKEFVHKSPPFEHGHLGTVSSGVLDRVRLDLMATFASSHGEANSRGGRAA